jgi:hypothetical protein
MHIEMTKTTLNSPSVSILGIIAKRNAHRIIQIYEAWIKVLDRSLESSHSELHIVAKILETTEKVKINPRIIFLVLSPLKNSFTEPIVFINSQKKLTHSFNLVGFDDRVLLSEKLLLFGEVIITTRMASIFRAKVLANASMFCAKELFAFTKSSGLFDEGEFALTNRTFLRRHLYYSLFLRLN